ncbi:MAG TPA: CaiB/BaiF CoA-transferase family protein [Novosphingobium sp.]|nr:CaiB/BaiF CoA-transferase family protein [Novosphingobium sp.]
MTDTNAKVPIDSPLQGVRVLEVAQYIAGPLAGQQLADFGAEVIKVERPGGGDPFRTYAGGRNIPNYGFNFRGFNRHKKSLVVDLGSPEAREIVKRVAAEVDVVVENFRPGVMDRLGIGYEALKAVNPNIIYCAITGFSADGPYRDRPAFDTVGQALSGMLYLFTDPENPRMRGPTVADQVTAMQAATAVLAMLRAREHTGQGGRIDISMVDAAASFMPDVYAGYTDADVLPTSETRVAASQAGLMACGDDKIVAVQLGGLDKAFSLLIEELGCPELAEDPRFVDRVVRSSNWSVLTDLLRPYFRKQPAAYWLARFLDRGVPCSEVLTIAEAVECPEMVHSGIFEKREHPVAGPMTMMRRAAQINGSRGPSQDFPPLLGEHSEAILRDLGYSEEEVSKMVADGLIVAA